jgi:GWxTD domain-containing protein
MLNRTMRRANAATLLAWALLGAPAGAQAPAADSARAGAADEVLGSSLQPGIGRGDFEFILDAASLQPAADGRTSVRALVQLPVRAFLEMGGKNRAELHLQVRAYAAAAAMQALEQRRPAAPQPGATEAEARRSEFEAADVDVQRMLGDFAGIPSTDAELRAVVEAADKDAVDRTDFRVFELGFDVAPGDYVIEVMARNLSRTKRGLLDRLRRRHTNALARVLLRVPDLRREPGLADLRFQSGYRQHSDYPARLYGLLNDSLHVSTALFAHGDYDVGVSASDRSGEVLWRDSLHVQVDGRRGVDLHTSVNTLPAGQYVLRVTARGPQGAVSASRGFDVAWSLVTWKKSRRDLDVEAEIALTEREYREYVDLPVGEKERYIENFWLAHDPTPDTAHNEVLEEFHRRVAWADINFSEQGRGALSDRGKVYVRFGPPDELQAEVVPMHLAGRGAEQALEKVDDVYVASEHERPEEPVGVEGTVRGVNPWDEAAKRQEHSRLVGPANEVVSYELWLYSGAGRPLLPQDDTAAVDTSLRVLFVDVDGYGRYRLRKSSARLDLHGIGANY